MKKQEGFIEDQLTAEDVEAWHNGELTEHVASLMETVGAAVIQIWGSPDGPEPLSVTVIE